MLRSNATTDNTTYNAATDDSTATSKADVVASIAFPTSSLVAIAYNATDASTATVDDDGTTTSYASTLYSTSSNDGRCLATIFICHMNVKIHSLGSLVERTVEGRDKEYEYLSTHTQEQEEVGSWQVGQLKQRTQDNDRCTP